MNLRGLNLIFWHFCLKYCAISTIRQIKMNRHKILFSLYIRCWLCYKLKYQEWSLQVMQLRNRSKFKFPFLSICPIWGQKWSLHLHLWKPITRKRLDPWIFNFGYFLMAVNITSEWNLKRIRGGRAGAIGWIDMEWPNSGVKWQIIRLTGKSCFDHNTMTQQIIVNTEHSRTPMIVLIPKQ